MSGAEPCTGSNSEGEVRINGEPVNLGGLLQMLM